MPVTLEEDDASCTLRLEGEMEISLALELKAQLLHALGSRKDLQVSLAGVTEMDITIMQLLLAVTSEASRLDRSIHLNGPVSEHLASSLAIASLCNSLEITG